MSCSYSWQRRGSLHIPHVGNQTSCAVPQEISEFHAGTQVPHKLQATAYARSLQELFQNGNAPTPYFRAFSLSETGSRAGTPPQEQHRRASQAYSVGHVAARGLQLHHRTGEGSRWHQLSRNLVLGFGDICADTHTPDSAQKLRIQCAAPHRPSPS